MDIPLVIVLSAIWLIVGFGGSCLAMTSAMMRYERIPFGKKDVLFGFCMALLGVGNLIGALLCFPEILKWVKGRKC